MKTETFPARLRRLRESRGWSQEKLAAETGISQPAISYLESAGRPGRTTNIPRADTLAILADVLGDGSLSLWDGVIWTE